MYQNDLTLELEGLNEMLYLASQLHDERVADPVIPYVILECFMAKYLSIIGLEESYEIIRDEERETPQYRRKETRD